MFGSRCFGCTAQPIGLLALMLLLPPLFLAAGYWEGVAARSWNMRKQLARYFSFQLVNVFLVTTIAGSALSVLQKILEQPKIAFNLLGASLPKVCAFFSCYIIIKVLTYLGLPRVERASVVLVRPSHAEAAHLTPAT